MLAIANTSDRSLISHVLQRGRFDVLYGDWVERFWPAVVQHTNSIRQEARQVKQKKKSQASRIPRGQGRAPGQLSKMASLARMERAKAPCPYRGKTCPPILIYNSAGRQSKHLKSPKGRIQWQ